MFLPTRKAQGGLSKPRCGSRKFQCGSMEHRVYLCQDLKRGQGAKEVVCIYRKLSGSDIELLAGYVDSTWCIRRTISTHQVGHLVGRVDRVGNIYSGPLVGRVDQAGNIYRRKPGLDAEQLVGRVGRKGRIYRILPTSNSQWLVGRSDSSNLVVTGGAALLLLLPEKKR